MSVERVATLISPQTARPSGTRSILRLGPGRDERMIWHGDVGVPSALRVVQSGDRASEEGAQQYSCQAHAEGRDPVLAPRATQLIDQFGSASCGRLLVGTPLFESNECD